MARDTREVYDAANPFIISEPSRRFRYTQLGSFTPCRYFNLECASLFRQIVFNFGVVVYFEETGDAGDRLECAVRRLVNFAEWASGQREVCRAAAQ